MSPRQVAMDTTGVTGAGPAGPGGGQAALKLEHACLQIYAPSKSGSVSETGGKLDQLDFQFNPKELTLTKSASWEPGNKKAAEKDNPPQFKQSQPTKLTLEMFFDASATPDDSVVKRVEKLFSCCIPRGAKESPPWVVFRWGTLTAFTAYVSSVQAKYSLFTAAGLPIRATCSATLEEISGAPPKQNPTSGGLLPRKAHRVIEGDTLAGIAFAEYGNPALWRTVATVNRIDDPMRLRPGATVLLPTADELSRPDRVAALVEEASRGLR